MKGGACKAKGTRYEKKIAKKIGKWWCGDENALVHAPGSGSRIHTHQGIFPGDIVPAKSVPDYCLSVETKHWEDWSIDELLRYPKSPFIIEGLKQCLNNANTVNFFPMFIFTKNYFPDILLFPLEIFFDVSDTDELARILLPQRYGLLLTIYADLGCWFKDQSLTFILLKDFFACVKKDTLVEYRKRYLREVGEER